MDGHGQPALLYLVPCTLGIVLNADFITCINADFLKKGCHSKHGYALVIFLLIFLCRAHNYIGFTERRVEVPLGLWLRFILISGTIFRSISQLQFPDRS